jgi:hypothetical protein
MAKQRSGNSSGLDTAAYKVGTRSGIQNDNPQWRDNTNQGRGPTAGNTGNPEKRKAFMEDKAGPEKTELAKMIMSAFAERGAGQQSHRDPTVEPIHAVTNVGRGPTRGSSGRPTKVIRGAR